MNESKRQDILLGLFAIGVLAALIGLSLKVGSAAPAGAVTYDFLLDSALGLQKDNRVTVAGVPVGVVDNLSVDGKMARVRLALDPTFTLYADAKAAVRARTLLGEKYVDLDPGAPPAPVLAPGSTVTDNIPTVEIDSVIRGAAELVASLNSVTPTLKTAAARLDTVLGTADAEAVTRDISTLVNEATRFLRTIQRNLGDTSEDARLLLRDLRTRAPEIVSRLDVTAQKLEALLDAVPVDAMQDAIKKSPGAVDTTTAAMADLRTAVAELRSTTQKSNRVLDNLDGVLIKVSSINEKQLREILQVEGVRVNLITDPDIERRVRALKPPAPLLPR